MSAKSWNIMMKLYKGSRRKRIIRRRKMWVRMAAKLGLDIAPEMLKEMFIATYWQVMDSPSFCKMLLDGEITVAEVKEMYELQTNSF
jgi:hypothetical protein